MDRKAKVFRYRVAPGLRFVLEAGAGLAWVGALYAMRLPSHDFLPSLLVLPPALLITAIALYFGRLTRFERIEISPDCVTWTDLWRRTHELPLSEIQSIDEDRIALLGTRFAAKGRHHRIRWFSHLDHHYHLLNDLRTALVPEQDRVPPSEFPWRGSRQYRYRLIRDRWVWAVCIIPFAIAVAVYYNWETDDFHLVFAGILVTGLLLATASRLVQQRILIAGDELIFRTGFRERMRVPLGSFRSVTLEPLAGGSAKATIDIDGGSFSITSEMLGYDEFVDSAQRIVIHRFENFRS